MAQWVWDRLPADKRCFPRTLLGYTAEPLPPDMMDWLEGHKGLATLV